MAASHKNKPQRKQKRPVIEAGIEVQINANKGIRTQFAEPITYENLTPSWSFKRMQKEQKWIFTPEEFICHGDDLSFHPKCVFAKLASFETMTWLEIKQQTHGREDKTNNHFIEDLSKLHKDARKRLDELKITENFFSLRLEGTMRIYGLLQSRVLEILWFDTDHEIHPMDK